MRKNLHYKILASVLAIAGLYFYNAPAAWAEIIEVNNEIRGDGTETVTINNNKIDINGTNQTLDTTDNIYGNYQDNSDANGDGMKPNTSISSSNLGNVYGGYSTNDNANKNVVNIDNNSNLNHVHGGYSANDNANNNIVNIDNSTSKRVFGGYASGTENSNANGNEVIISDSTITGSSLYGGYSVYGGASDNIVTIENSIATDLNIWIIGGYAPHANDSTKYSAINNTVKLIGSTNVENADIYGGRTDGGNPYNIDLITGNKLILENWSGSVKSVQNFSDINFENIKWDNGGTVLNITESPENAFADTNINVNSIAGGSNIAEGDTMTLITGDNLGVKADKITINPNFYAGVATEGTGSADVNADGSVTFTVDTLKAASQTKLVAENRAVAAAFINQGTDLISDSLDTLSRDGNYGVKTFAAVQGNRSKYDVNSDLKINGWSTIVGVGSETEHNGGDFSWGVFYENGSGNYRTFNEFNNEFFRGDGSLVYNGGGIAVRYENAHGVYTEGSLRAGMLKSDMDNALRDGSGNYYGYDSESAYYGAHIGVGKIISLSDSSDLDVYGKFFHTYTEGDSFTVANDKFEFDSITSDRLRLGARVTTNKANAFSTYYGLAYEYEFNGDAEMRAQNLAAPTQSLQGSSYMAELGFNYQPTPDSPWNFDLNMRGYAGEREGATFNVQATYTF